MSEIIKFLTSQHFVMGSLLFLLLIAIILVFVFVFYKPIKSDESKK